MKPGSPKYKFIPSECKTASPTRARPAPPARSQLLLYLAVAPEEKIKYAPFRAQHAASCAPTLRSLCRYIDGGERAVTRFEEGAQGYETRAFRGLGVFTSTPFEVSDDSDSCQMLQRSSQVGEFYRMSPPHVWDRTKQLPPQYMVRAGQGQRLFCFEYCVLSLRACMPVRTFSSTTKRPTSSSTSPSSRPSTPVD